MDIQNNPGGATELQVDARGPVLWHTITREERRNALSHGVIAGMAQAIVITGAGSKAFCAGADLQASKAFISDYSEPHAHLAKLQWLLDRILDTSPAAIRRGLYIWTGT